MWLLNLRLNGSAVKKSTCKDVRNSSNISNIRALMAEAARSLMTSAISGSGHKGLDHERPKDHTGACHSTIFTSSLKEDQFCFFQLVEIKGRPGEV